MPAERTLARDVVCPFCGLACDDLVIEQDGAQLRLREGGCARSRAEFEQEPRHAEPQIAGQPGDLESAIARAAALLRDSRLPLFAGLATDVDGMRAVMRLAERTGGVVDHLGTEALFRNLRVLQDAGWITTTLGEVRNHMDLLLVFGADPSAAFPRFVERCVRPPRTLFGEAPPERQVVRIGPPAPPAAAEGRLAATELPCAIERLPEVAAALRALVNDRPVAVPKIAGLPVARLRETAERLRAARYGVVAWAATEFDFAGAELTVQALAALVQELNRTTRCALLPLTGDDNLIGVNQVCTWQSGYPLRTGFGRGVPEHDPCRFSARYLVEAAQVDTLVWVAAIHATPPPTVPNLPTVVIARPDTVLASPPEVFIPVGTPGIDHGGQIFRMDGVVSLPLRALRGGGLPSVAETLARIDKALAPPGDSPG